MKKGFIFFLGVITGALLIIFISLIITGGNSKMTFFDEPGEIINAYSFEVFQTLDNGTALASKEGSFDLVVLLWNKDGRSYYDNQVVSPKPGQRFRQVGLYKYRNPQTGNKVVPIVALVNY